jgi:hypothetical protein
MIFLAEIPDLVYNLNERLRQVIHACDTIMQCDALVIVLRKVLAVGNTMNEGSHAGEAIGFALESLPRLWSTKGSDKKTTVLDFVVRMVLTRDPELADLPQRLLPVSNCRTSIQSDLIGRVQKIQTRLKNQMKYTSTSTRDSNIQLYDTDSANEEFNQRIRKIENHVAHLKQNSDALIDRSQSLAKYWGESIEHFATEKVFKVLYDFSVAFQNSVNSCQELQRKEKKMKMKKSSPGAGRTGNYGKSMFDSLSSSPMLAQVALQKRRQAVRGGDDEDGDSD